MTDKQPDSNLSLHTLLAEMRQNTTQNTAMILIALRNINTELGTLRTLLTQRRPNSNKTQRTVEEVIPAIVRHVTDYFSTHRTPLHLHMLTRLFGRRISATGMLAQEIVQSATLLAQLKVATTDSGGIILMPLSVWEHTTEDQRQFWLSAKVRELAEVREGLRALEIEASDAAEMKAQGDLTNSPLAHKSAPEGNTA